jgi:predicted RNase H-like HicB family nuclease
MSETLQLTIVYEDAGNGWIMASIPQVPGTRSQGRTRDEARANVIGALRVMLEGDKQQIEAHPSESREVVEVILRPFSADEWISEGVGRVFESDEEEDEFFDRAPAPSE